MRLRPTLIQVISSLLIFLFVYAGLSKLLELQTFRAVLRHSPVIAGNAGWVSVAVPMMELLISVLLFLPRTRSTGLWCAFVLMLLFTGYIAYLVAYGGKLPCSCGGVLKFLGWKEHLLFNIFFTLLAWIGIVLQEKEPDKLGKRHLPV